MKSSLSALIDISKTHRTLLQELTKTHQLTISEWQLLSRIVSGDNTQERLAESTKLDTSTLSRQLKGLVNKEMVGKTAVGRDRRQLIYAPTATGTETLQAINTAFNQLSDRIFEHWPEDEQNLLQILLNRLDKSLNRHQVI